MCVSDVPTLSEVVPAGGTTGVIPLSVEMLSDSDDDDDRKPPPPPHLGASVAHALSAGPAAGSSDGQSKLLLLKMASEFVEAAAAAASLQPSTPGMMDVIVSLSRLLLVPLLKEEYLYSAFLAK